MDRPEPDPNNPSEAVPLRAEGLARVRGASAGERWFRSLVENAADVITILNADGTVRYQSPAAERVLGSWPEERVGTDAFAAIHPDDRESAKAIFGEILEKPGLHPPQEFRVPHKDGSWRYLEHVANNLLHEPAVRGIVVNSRDVTERKRYEDRLRFQAQILGAVGEAVIAVDGDDMVLYWNRAAEDLYGWSAEEAMGRNLTEMVVSQELEDRAAQIMARVRRGEGWAGEFEVRHRDGTLFPVEATNTPVFGEDGGLVGVIGVLRDITERKVMQGQMEHRAFHDPLTDLPNRQLFLDRLGQALARTGRRRGGGVAVLFIDLDCFKVVNDSLGHDTGDRLLVEVAGRLKGCLRPEDTLARFGGDEFIVLLEDVEGAGGPLRVTQRITEEFRGPFVLDGRELFVRLSIGLALGDARTGSSGELLRNADTAMYRAKDDAADYRMFDPMMHEQALSRLELEGYLRQALEREEFTLYYQPKFRLGETDRIEEFEALVRWEHPQKGFMLPDEFIPLAEETGLIIPIGGWVTKEACRQAKEWQGRYPGEPPLAVCVNLSAAQVRHPGLLKDVRSALVESGLAANGLVLEITEGTLLKDTEVIETVFKELKVLGVGLAIDDFGKEYSSLSYLNRLPVDSLKIDRLFLEGFGEDPRNTMIVEAVISLAHSLGLEVTGEGVESAEQLELLRGMGCDFAQGYHLARPLPSEEVGSLLAYRATT